MELILRINDKDEIFIAPFVSGLHFRKLLEFDETIDYSDINIKDYDEVAGFVCELFDNRFTVNEFFNGTRSHLVMPTFMDVFAYVRTGEDYKSRNKKEEDEEGNDQGK